MKSLNSKISLPSHVGIIMDGNRRWAKKHFLPSIKGHARGAEVFKSICRCSSEMGIKYLTAYAFSTENWKRSKEEITYLMGLLGKYLNEIIAESFDLENVKIRFIGDTSKFSSKLTSLMQKIEIRSSQNTGMTLNIAINYGSHEEISSAVKSISQDVLSGKLSPNNISENEISRRLYTGNQPDVDLIIRTAGEQRISNFMLWQSAYAEFYFTKTLWPDFSIAEFHKAIMEYNSRVRRFGGA